MKFCVNCGTQLEDDKKFCVQCGTPVDNQQNETTVNATVEPQHQAQAQVQTNFGSTQNGTYAQPNYNAQQQYNVPPQYNAPPAMNNQPYYNNQINYSNQQGFGYPQPQPISIGGWIGRSLIPLIPVVGTIVFIIMLFIWSGDTTKELTFRNWAKAQLILSLIALGLVILIFVFFALAFSRPYYYNW